jgi:hypothetical protein
MRNLIPTEKMLKIAEIKNDFAVHFDRESSYIEFMKGTYPVNVLSAMWHKFGRETCVFVLDETEKEGTPPTRILKPRGFVEAELGLAIVPPRFVYEYPVRSLALFKRADRVIVCGTGSQGVITGLKAKQNEDGLWLYEVSVAGQKEHQVFTEDTLKFNEDHAANKPETDFINREVGRVRAPAGQKKPV